MQKFTGFANAHNGQIRTGATIAERIALKAFIERRIFCDIKASHRIFNVINIIHKKPFLSSMTP